MDNAVRARWRPLKTCLRRDQGEGATPTFLASQGFSKCLSSSKFSSIAGT